MIRHHEWLLTIFFYHTHLAPFVPDNCTEGNVRLLSGFRNGTVQVCVNRTWGSICDSGWSSQDADVVCRQLGFTTLGTNPQLSCDILWCDCLWFHCYQGAISYSNSFYGNTSGPMWIDNGRCTGSENSILNCTHNGIGVLASSCDHMDESGVECPGRLITVSKYTNKVNCYMNKCGHLLKVLQQGLHAANKARSFCG